MISVILTISESCSGLERAIQSVRRQTFPNWELLVFDSGARTETLQSVRRLAADEPRIRLFAGSAKPGPKDDWCLFWSQARGDYVTYLECEDEYYPDYLERVKAWQPRADVLVFAHTVAEGSESGHGLTPPYTWDASVGHRRLRWEEIVAPLGVAHRYPLPTAAGSWQACGPDWCWNLLRHLAESGVTFCFLPVTSGVHRPRPPAPRQEQGVHTSNATPGDGIAAATGDRGAESEGTTSIRVAGPRGHRRRVPATDVITMSRFGKLGRFGNQLFQYMFLKTYAREHALELQLPPWIGNCLFGTQDRPLTAMGLPVVREKYVHGVEDTLIPHAPRPFRGCDFDGYFQYHTSFYVPYRDYIQSLFQPTAEVGLAVQGGWERIARRGRTRVGIHIRRGDYGQGWFYLVPAQWYVRQLDRLWPALDAPVLFVATDDRETVVEEFCKYGALTCADMLTELPEAPEYLDFYALTQCDILLIPNSTFSYAATMLNTRLRLALRSFLPF